LGLSVADLEELDADLPGDVAADSKDKDGRTPLSLAAAMGHEAVAKLLQRVQGGG
jgi:ankyrin repeat protein